MRSTLVITALFLLASALATALAAPLAASPGPLRFVPLGFASAQVMLAAAAVVLLRRGLWLRLSLLGAALTAWPLLHSAVDRMPVFVALLGVALFTATWCGGMRLLGWRVVLPDAEEDSYPEPIGQFSLATVMLTTAIFAVFLGWLRTCWGGGAVSTIQLPAVWCAVFLTAQLALVVVAVAVLSSAGFRLVRSGTARLRLEVGG